MAQGLPADADGDWTDEVTDRIESVVERVRDKTTVPVIIIARGIVFGFIIGTLGAMVIVLLVVAGVRLLDDYLPIHPDGRKVWVGYSVVSAIFFAIGAFLWRKSYPRTG
jgi:hypothetical protein